MIVTLMEFVFGPKPSTGILMPLMITADIFAVIYYHRHTQWNYLGKLLPAMVIGVLFGVWLGDTFSAALFKQVMAVLILVTIVIMIVMERRRSQNIPHNKLFSNGIGLFAGFTSMIGNLAGPLANIYFLAMRLPKNEFIGTAAWLFFVINVFKLPFHIAVWKTITVSSVLIDLYLLPGLLLGFFVGVRVVKLIKNDTYRKYIFAITAIGALLILFK